MVAKLTPTNVEGVTLITAYGDGGFRIAGTRHEGSVTIVNGQVRSLAVAAAAELDFAQFDLVRTAEPAVEILLIGTGQSLVLPPEALRTALSAAGIAIDFMDSGAAARTFNVLALEDRRVAAVLIAVP